MALVRVSNFSVLVRRSCLMKLRRLSWLLVCLGMACSSDDGSDGSPIDGPDEDQDIDVMTASVFATFNAGLVPMGSCLIPTNVRPLRFKPWRRSKPTCFA